MPRSLKRAPYAVLGFALGTAALAAVAPSASASPSAVPQVTARVDCLVVNADGTCDVPGVVYAMVQVGDLTYIGGNFASIGGVPRANVAAIRSDGTLDPTWNPSTDGIVYALAASSDGTKIFMGGAFTTVDGQARRLAAVTPVTGALVSSWTTNTNNNLIRALSADADDRLYVGGSFGRIGGRAVPKLAAVSQSTGAVDTAFHPTPSATIRALTLSDDGSKLYAGGGFSTIGGATRLGAAELFASTGAVTSFAPSDGGVVISMDINSNGRLFFGTTSNRTWAYDPAVSNTGLYRVRTGGDVQAIYATNDEVYIGGHFNTLPEAKLNRLALASFVPADGAPTAWNPGANGPFGVWAIGPAVTVLSPDAVPALSIGGDFSRVGGVARRGYTRFLF
jgi:hypothetical protein